MKRIYTQSNRSRFLLSGILCLCFLTPVRARILTVTIDDMTYSINTYSINMGIATVTKYSGTATSLTIPKTVSVDGVNHFPVTIIEAGAFSSCTTLEQVNTSDVTTINNGTYERGAFYDCSNLKQIDMPNVTIVGTDAFLNCTSLAQIDMPNVKTIRSGAFSGCTSLTQVNMPNVTTIEGSFSEGAFAGCINLTQIDMPNATTIRGYAFNGCNSVTEVYLGKEVNLTDANSTYRTALPHQAAIFSPKESHEYLQAQYYTVFDIAHPYLYPVYVDATPSSLSIELKKTGYQGKEVTIKEVSVGNQKATTDAQGRYCITGLSPETEYEVSVCYETDEEEAIVTYQMRTTDTPSANDYTHLLPDADFERDFMNQYWIYYCTGTGTFTSGAWTLDYETTGEDNYINYSTRIVTKTPAEGNCYMECWAGGLKSFDLHQTISGLSKGTYRIKALMRNLDSDDYLTDQHIYAETGGKTYDSPTLSSAGVGTEVENWEELTTEPFQVTDETQEVRIGACSTNDGTNAYGWFQVDRFQIIRTDNGEDAVIDVINNGTEVFRYDSHNGRLYLRAQQDGTSGYAIATLDGRTVAHGQIAPDGTWHSVDMSATGKGIYLLQMTADRKTIGTFKFAVR